MYHFTGFLQINFDTYTTDILKIFQFSFRFENVMIFSIFEPKCVDFDIFENMKSLHLQLFLFLMNPSLQKIPQLILI